MSAHANRHGHLLTCDNCKIALRVLKTLGAIYPKFSRRLSNELQLKIAQVN